jgi:hypothetical protein
MQPELDLFPTGKRQILLLVDWDNFWYSLMNRFGVGEMNIEHRIEKLVEWVKGKGELLGGHGFIFAPEHLSSIHQEICINNGLWFITCPKKQLSEARMNKKTRELELRVDTVDETIINFAKMMIGHPNFGTICLVSGDNDYVPLFEEMGRCNIKRALIAPTVDSLSKTKELINLVDNDPATNEKMLLILDRI